MSNLLIKEEFLQVERSENADGELNEKRIGLGDSNIYETYTDNVGKLFKSLQREHGRCVSRIYRDFKDGSSKSVGWVFEKTAYYEDTKQSYILETWVTLYTAKPDVQITHHYKFLE